MCMIYALGDVSGEQFERRGAKTSKKASEPNPQITRVSLRFINLPITVVIDTVLSLWRTRVDKFVIVVTVDSYIKPITVIIISSFY